MNSNTTALAVKLYLQPTQTLTVILNETVGCSLFCALIKLIA